ncbi:MAG: hypothetical protein P8P36_02000 [Akkermansiaceae bacterium]|nr:hypothetical protein [Akkermansiaceae bacterium]
MKFLLHAMLSYNRDPQQTIPESSVKIIGLGGAGANMLDRATLDGLTGPEMTCVNTDLRTLSSSVAAEKIHLGKNLTKGLGSGGDPELGARAAQESESELRDALRGRKMVFLCVGLGGGTGSGAAPLIARIAREEGAFVVVFGTMPFGFEGQRRREQADTALNELSVLANAVVTFDNDRMGELVLAKQGIHEAFAACDTMISESIKAVTRLVVRPGLINIGLADLMSALNTTRSRCLFGSGSGQGENRSQQAIENALNSPLLDKGHLLADASSVLIHVCGDESLTLYEVELLMQSLSKHIPKDSQVLFGVATDPSMEGELSVTLISAVPEEKIHSGVSHDDNDDQEDESSLDDQISASLAAVESSRVMEAPEDEQIMEPSEGFSPEGDADDEDPQRDQGELDQSDETSEDSQGSYAEFINMDDVQDLADAVLKDAEFEIDHGSNEEAADEEEVAEQPFAEIEGLENDELEKTEEGETESSQIAIDQEQSLFGDNSLSDKQNAQGELELDGGPKGKFEGESPNVLEGEDLDIPPFLRNKKK